MFSTIPLHLALLLVPYLDPVDLARARRVCKHWHAVFSSATLLQATLRIHFPLSHEARFPPQSSNYSAFNRVAKRYAALKSGVPQQELRFPIASGYLDRHDYPVWAFSENLIAFQNPSHCPSHLDLIYLDTQPGSRRMRSGRLLLPPPHETRRVFGLKVCRDMLLVERAHPAPVTGWEFSVDCFRLSLQSGSPEVVATDKYSFIFKWHDYNIISDHSGKYYAAYLRTPLSHPNPGLEVIQVWDIETGEVIQRINGPFFHESPGVKVTDIMVVAKQGPHGPQQVVISGSNHSSIDSSDFDHLLSWPGEGSSHTELRVFPIGDGPSGWDGYVKQAKGCRPYVFKVPRSPTGIAAVDDPASPEYESEKIGLAFWGMDSTSGDVISSYHNLIPDELAGASRVPLTADGECRMYCKTGGGHIPSPFVVQRHSGLSFTLTHPSWRETRRPDAPLSYSYVTLRSFYPSATPGLMELEWESYTRFPNDGKQIQQFLGDFSEGPLPFKDICGDEFATAFLHPWRGELCIVLLVWDERFSMGVKGGVMVR